MGWCKSASPFMKRRYLCHYRLSFVNGTAKLGWMKGTMKVWWLHIIHLLLAPLYFIALPQGLWLKKHALRMPEAEGPRKMSLGHTQSSRLKLLYLGESPAAGVGIESINDAVSARVARNLTDVSQIDFQLLAQNGITLKELLLKLQRTQTHAPDISIINMGVNDCTNLTSCTQWQIHIHGLVQELKNRGSKHIFFTAVPPLQQFPLLPAPLSWLMGHRANILNILLENICRQHHIQFLPFSAQLTPQLICIDGYHPNEKGAELWANSITRQIIPIIK